MALCEMNIQDSINIDLNVTSICNFACTYCSEQETDKEMEESGNSYTGCNLATLHLKNSEVKVETLINKLGSDPAKKKKINFWGGEPFINWEMCKAVMEGFQDDEKFSFFFYTNGDFIEMYEKDLRHFHKILGNRLEIQVSYDGNWLTNNIRIDKQGKGTADRVIKGWNKLKEIGIKTTLKSVISNVGFPHLFDTFVELYKLQGFYGPTPDMWSDRTPEELLQDSKILEVQLEKIASYIYANDIDPNVFTWFSKHKAMCSVGVNMASIDLDGSLKPCHGFMYRESDEHTTGHLDNFSEDFRKASEKFKPLYEYKPTECQTCDVNFCMKCEASNFFHSTKENYDEKWTDYNSNQTCGLFKFVDKYNKTIRYAMQNKG